MKIYPKKSLGQNFLANPRILDRIAAAAEIEKNDIILEVGPGTGNLTKKLAEKAEKVIAVEKDRRLIEPLRRAFENYTNIEIIEGDILKLRPKTHNLKSKTYKIVANLPYYITSNFLRIVFEKWPQSKLIVLLIQKEVAQRIIAKPPHTNLLALSIQYYSDPEIIGYVSKNNFQPAPKVDSAIIKLTPKNEILNPDQTEEIFKLIKAGLGEKRKQLANNLAEKLDIPKEQTKTALEKLGLNPASRAENLSLNQWESLNEYLKK